jgi:thiol-disulfide isomerase/thioredoxin
MKTPAYIAIALVAAAAGFGIYHFGIAPRAEREQRVNAAEAAQVAGQEPAPAAAVPDVLPDFTLGDIDGQQRSIRSWTGKSMIVNFWATWCAPCRREIPLLKKLQAEHGAEGFQIVGVAVDFREDVLKYAKDIGIDYPVLIGEQDGLDAVNKFGQGSLGFPFTVFTDNQQRIVMFHLGEIRPEQVEVFLGAVRKVNSGELTVAAARTVVAEQLSKLAPAEE